MHEAEERQRETVGIKEKEEKKSQEWVSTSSTDSDSTEMSLDDENDALSTSDKRLQGKSKKDPRKARKHVGSSSEEENQTSLEVTNVKKKKRRIISSASSSVPSFFDSPRSSKQKEWSMQPSVEVKVPFGAGQIKSRQPSPATNPAQLSFGQLQPGIFDPDPPVEARLGGGLCGVSHTAASTVISSVSAATQSFTTMQQSQFHPLQSVRPSQAPDQTQTQSSRQLSPLFQPQPQPQLQAQFVLQPHPETQRPNSLSAASVSGLPAGSPKSQPKATTIPTQGNSSTRIPPGATHDSPMVVVPAPTSTTNTQEDNEESLFTPPPGQEDLLFTPAFDATDEVLNPAFVLSPIPADQPPIQQPSQASLKSHLGLPMPEDANLVQAAQEVQLEKGRLEVGLLERQREGQKRKEQQEKDRINAAEKLMKMREIQKPKKDKEKAEREEIAKKRAEKERAGSEKAAFSQIQFAQEPPMASRISQSYQPRQPAPQAQQPSHLPAPVPTQPQILPASQTLDRPAAQPSASTLISSFVSPTGKQTTSVPDERANNRATHQRSNASAQSSADQVQCRSITPVVQHAFRPVSQPPLQPKSQSSVQLSAQQPTQSPTQSYAQLTTQPTPHQTIEGSSILPPQPTATYPSASSQAAQALPKGIHHDIIYNLDTLLRLRRIRSDGPTEAFNSLPTPASATHEQHRSFPILCPVNSQGGIVTFAPSLILEEPKLFENFMKALKKTTLWGAYLAPPVITYFDQSWGDEE